MVLFEKLVGAMGLRADVRDAAHCLFTERHSECQMAGELLQRYFTQVGKRQLGAYGEVEGSCEGGKTVSVQPRPRTPS